MLVMKFGGTSVGNPDRILQLIEIVKEASIREPVVVVVSAMSGITNLLEEACLRAAAQDETFRQVVDTISGAMMNASEPSRCHRQFLRN